MANCGKEILSTRQGTGQLQRFVEALEPGSVKLNNFSLNEWMRFAWHFAEKVNYFDTLNHESASGNWQDFFISNENLEDFLLLVDEGGNLPPHLALFVCFIKLLEFSKKRFNKLTKRHLDFYYQQILQIEKLPATPDKVHVIFELAKNNVDSKIGQSTELDGGKDSTGKKRVYKTNEELIANRTIVSSLRSLYNDHENSKLKVATVANSYDGAGTDFPDGEIKWWPFGYFGDANYPELPDAKIGFALSSEILELQEGSRNILITAEFSDKLEPASTKIIQENIEIFCSGEKKWLGPFSVQPVIFDDDGNIVFSSAIDEIQKTIKFAFEVPREEKPLVAYNSEVLGENFNTELPVCRIIIKTENKEGFELYRNLVEKEMINLTINVDVRGVKTLSLESDIGALNAKKPFYPFGTQPVKRSHFYIDYPELFKKQWKSLDVKINWKNTPEKSLDSDYEAFVDLYFAYRTDYLYQANASKFFTGMFHLLEVENLWKFNSAPQNLIVKSNGHFKANVEIKDKEEWEGANLVESDLVDKEELILFAEDGNQFQTNFGIEVNDLTRKSGPVRLSLNQSFLHELFPRIYALAFSSKEEGVIIPNEPYTPMVETVVLNYTARVEFNKGTLVSDYVNNGLKLFHEHPFGQSEEHPYLKNKPGFLSDDNKKLNLVPTYCKGGELYIGLESAEKLQQVSLLIQAFEGSENPLADSFTGKQKAEWSVLCENEWKSLDSSYMVSNETDNFLKSGIVKFSIPKEITQNNTILPAGFVWVKVKIHKNYDAVCKIISIVAQAVLAEFADNGNDLSHLEKGLEAKTISKLIQRVATIKNITQPFSSFGGTPEESDSNYYRRISERLRHKNRAITLWDYEHLILQQFPEIHKAKCLNHTSETSFLSPGNVTVVVIPDIVNKNVFDIYQPRVSKATLNTVQEFVNKLNTLHVNAKIINPDYEEVTVDLKVKFYKGYDESYYLKVLNDDIIRLLSPWAFEETASINFGVTLHRSFVINFIEKLKYVDYVENVKLKKGEEVSLTQVAPSSPKAILVSAKQHILSTEIKSCKVITETVETCQT